MIITDLQLSVSNDADDESQKWVEMYVFILFV